MMIQVCLNGGRTKQECPNVPISLDEIIEDIQVLKNLGIEHFHVHLRGSDGKETFDNNILAPQMHRLRHRFPEIKIGLSSNLFEGMTPELRHRKISQWEFQPDTVSVNLSEPGSLGIWNVLKEKNIKPEAGIWTMDEAKIFAENKLDQYCERVLIEIFVEEIEEALLQADQICAFLTKHNKTLEQVHHGEGKNTWTIIDKALENNFGCRIGLEDTLVLRDGRKASGNKALYKELNNK